MRTFELHRLEDETGISGVGIVAEGVVFRDGTCAMRWLTKDRSTATYDSLESLERIHGHAGKTKVVIVGAPFERAMQDAMQDACENAPFASIGGLGQRTSPIPPHYIAAHEHERYVEGYKAACVLMYGKDWETAPFGWAPAMTINAPADRPPHATKGSTDG
jgi:hypothetical protein